MAYDRTATAWQVCFKGLYENRRGLSQCCAVRGAKWGCPALLKTLPGTGSFLRRLRSKNVPVPLSPAGFSTAPGCPLLRDGFRIGSKGVACVCRLLPVAVLTWAPLVALAVMPQTTVQPSAAITYVVENSVPPVDAGMIDMFAGNFAPGGTLVADGSLLPIAPNQALFAQLGSTYGGNGVSTFSLPDLNGRVPIEVGQGIGLTNRAIGSTTGVNQLTLTMAQLPTVVGGQNQAITNMQPSLTLTYLIAINGIFPSNGGSEDGAPLVGQVFLSASSNAVSNPPQGFLPAQGQVLPIAQYQTLFAIIGANYGGNGINTFALPDLRGRAVVDAGSGVGLTPRNVGDAFGTEATMLIPANLPPPTGFSQAYSNLQPSQGLNYIIAVAGVFPPRGPGGSFDNTDPFLGEIALFAGNYAPVGWAMCNGQVLPISSNTALFSILGTTYGGNGFNSFALPDLRGRVVVAQITASV